MLTWCAAGRVSVSMAGTWAGGAVVGHFPPSFLGTVHNAGSILTLRPPLSPKEKWHLLRVSPENLKTYQMFPSGKRVSPQERQKRDSYFEFRA